MNAIKSEKTADAQEVLEYLTAVMRGEQKEEIPLLLEGEGGIQWRMLPSDFPNWKLVYYYFTVWSNKNEIGVSILDSVLKKISENDSRR